MAQNINNEIYWKENGDFLAEYITSGHFTLYTIDQKEKDMINSYRAPYIHHLIFYVKPWKGVTNVHILE